MFAVYGGGKGLPDPSVARIFLQHAFGMKLKPHQEIRMRIVIGFNEIVIGIRHRSKAMCEIANPLMMIAVHSEILSAIPPRERSSGKDDHGMPVGIIVVIVNVRAVRALFDLHVSEKRASANHVYELASSADTQYGELAAKGVAHQPEFDFVFETVGVFDVLEVGLAGREPLRLDILAFHKQQAVHARRVLREACRSSWHYWNDHGQDVKVDQKFEMKFAYIVDVLAFPSGSPGTNDDNGAVHRAIVRSASTSLASFSRPCEATRT